MRRETGTALLLVLWVTILLATLLVGFAAVSRSHGEAALYGAEKARAEWAAEAGIAQAVIGLRTPDDHGRWVPDGRTYTFRFDGARVTVAVIDVNGLINLNAATPTLLQHLFQIAGMPESQAVRWAAQIVRARRGTYRRNEAQIPRMFWSPRQLAAPFELNVDTYARIERSLTVFSGSHFPDAAYAGSQVLAALRNLSLADAGILVDQRRRTPARGRYHEATSSSESQSTLVAGYGTGIEQIYSIAKMPDGTRAEIETTLNLEVKGAGHPYTVLDWQFDPLSP